MNDMEKLAGRTLSGINPNLTIVKFQTFDQQIADRFNDDRIDQTADFAVWRARAVACDHRTLRRYGVHRRAAYT